PASGKLPDRLAPPFPGVPFYSRVDLDGCNDGPDGLPTLPPRLPGFGAPPTRCFPVYPPGFGSGSRLERTDHPLIYNALVPPGQGFGFAPSNMEALLRHGDTGWPSLTCELFRLCPKNFAGSSARDPSGPLGTARRRRLVTMLSYDVDKPGVIPWVWNPRER